ncbi:MAG TPA: VCBS repeat-containing protein, partial [Planctomycetota bacterium]|nr:VCBS repeat-containing protein [Planctomycetota bacterium]
MSCLNSSLPCRGRALVLAASALLAALPALSGGARAQFATAISIPAATAPQCVAAGDWDGDLDEDLAIAIASTERVLFLFNDGHEHFLTPIEVQLGTGTSPASIVASDLDGDGDLDVAVSLLGTDSVRVLLNNGGGTFALGSETSTGADPVVLRAGDFNGGAPDLVTCNRAGNSITVLLNTGSASFTASTLGTGPSPRDVNVGDLNGDGDIDIAVAVHDNRRIELYANGGTGA